MKITTGKRLIMVLLSAVMVLSLFACGDSSTESTTDADPDISTETEAIDTESDTEGKSETDSESKQTDAKTESAETENTETESTETESTEIEKVETEQGRDVVSFVDYTSESRSSVDLKDGAVAVSFTVPAESYLQEFYLNLNNEAQYVACNIDVAMYRFNGDYSASVKADPIYTKTITSSLKTSTLKFEDKQFGAGDYILVVSCTAEATGNTSVMIDAAWNANKLPEQYKEYALTSYINGEQAKTVLCCAMAIDRALPVVTPEEDKTPNTAKDADNVAKVILLAGQSNAAGVSQSALLQKKIDAKEFEIYKNGFSNVKILYKNGNLNGMQNCNEEFVEVKLGQGIDIGSFGPEIGLAAYLSEAYPDETFYIIKYGVGGTNLFAHWNAKDSSRNAHLTGFKDTIDAGLDLLEEDGLTPKIVGLLWMQGESDSTQFYHAHEYYNREKALVEDIRKSYADYASARGIALIDAATSDSGFFASWFLVNSMKLQYSKESLDNYYIDTVSYGLSTLEENNDLPHYDSMSMLILGRLFGDKLAFAMNNDKDDEVCPHKMSEIKADKDVHYSECVICKTRLTAEAHLPVGALKYDSESKSYKGACVCGADAYNDVYFSTEARISSGGCEDVAISTGSEDGDDYVRYTPTANKRARVYLIFGNTNVTGQYMILKYRFVNNNTNSHLKDTFAATTQSTNPMARGNGDACGNFGILIGDGEWHYLVVDLAAKNAESNAAGANLQFIADANGQYAVKYIRADFLAAAYDGSCYLDVADIGFVDQLDAASKFITVCEHTVYKDAVYDPATKSYKRECSMCGEPIYQDLLTYLEGRVGTGACENVTVTTGTENGDDYVRYTQNADKRVRFYIIHGNTTVTGQYLVLKYRLVNNNTNTDLKDTFVATAASSNGLANGKGDASGNLGTLIGDGEWHYLVVDLLAKNKAANAEGTELQYKADENGKYACKYIRADFLLQAYDGSCYLDIASVGFADALDAANKFKEVCPHTNLKTVEAKEATCTEKGHEAYSICNACEVILNSEGVVVDAIPETPATSPTAKGEIVYNAETKLYEDNCSACGVAVTTQELLTYLEGRVGTGACENVTVTTGTENGDDYVRYTQNADKRVRFYIIHGNTTVTGQYLVLKYRLVNNNTNTDLKDTFVATAASSNGLANGKGDASGNLGTLIGDGEWHYLVVDLLAKNKAANAEGTDLQYKADENGKYACKYIRADFLLEAYDGSCYLDIASVGFADQKDVADKIANTCYHFGKTAYEAKAATCTEGGNEAYSVCKGCQAIFNANGEIVDAIPTTPAAGHSGVLEYVEAEEKCNEKCGACGIVMGSYSILHKMEGRTSLGACESLAVTTGTENGDDYVRYMQTENKRVRFYPIFGNTAVTGQYLVLKYRLVNNNVDTTLGGAFAATTASANPMARGNGDECGTLGTLIGDGEWHYLVVDLLAKNQENGKAGAELQFKADSNGDYACKYIRADFLLQAYDGSCYLDIASVGFAG